MGAVRSHGLHRSAYALFRQAFMAACKGLGRAHRKSVGFSGLVAKGGCDLGPNFQVLLSTLNASTQAQEGQDSDDDNDCADDINDIVHENHL